MPAKLSMETITKQKDHMYKTAVALIRQKGLRELTIEDITNEMQIAKGSFYHYYKSKEEFLYEVIKRNKEYYFNLILSEKNAGKRTREEIQSVLETYFLSDESLFGYLLPKDVDDILHRLHQDVQMKESEACHTTFESICELFGLRITEENYGALCYLLDSLQSVIRGPEHYGDAGRKRATQILTNAIVDFILEENKG